MSFDLDPPARNGSSSPAPRHRTVALLLAASLLGVSPASAATRLVATSGADSGTCTAAACASLGYALSQASPGDTVRLDPGTYVTHAIVDRAITIEGAGVGATVLTGGGTDRVLFITADVAVVIRNLTVRDGNSVASSFGGGGLLAATAGSAVSLESCELVNNRAAQGGGAILAKGALSVDGCRIESNQAQSRSSSAGALGGGIYADGPSLTIRNSSITGNSAIGLDVLGNGANGGLASGGGIHAVRFGSSAMSVVIERSLVAGNSTLGGGAGAGGYGGPATGGGLSIITLNGAPRTTATIADSTLDGNVATAGAGDLGFSSAGGGLYAGAVDVALLGTTVTDNRLVRQAPGGFFPFGAALASDDGASVVLANTLIAGNVGAPSCVPSGPAATITSAGHNLFSTGCTALAASDLSGTSLVPLDPMIGALLDNGGPSLTRALLPGSLAIDAGDPAMCGPTDQRGIPRDAACDIGAFELESIPTPTPAPTASPTPAPTPAPTASPTPAPTPAPTASPTPEPTASPTPAPTAPPTPGPTLTAAPITVSILDVTVSEGERPKQTMAKSWVTLSRATDHDVVVPWSTRDGQAVSPADYRSRSGEVTIAAGSTRAAINVQVFNDTAREGNETFALVLGTPNGTEGVVKGLATVTVVDDD